MMRHIRGLLQMHIIMVSYYGIHKGNRRLQGQAMSHMAHRYVGADAARKFMKEEYVLKNILSNRIWGVRITAEHLLCLLEKKR